MSSPKNINQTIEAGMSNDEEMQADINDFRGRYKQMALYLKLLPCQSLLITIKDYENFTMFESQLTKEYIKENGRLDFMFDCPKSLMKDLIKNFKLVVINSDGNIEFPVGFTNLSKPGSNQIIPIEPVDVQEEDVFQMKNQMMREFFEEEKNNLKAIHAQQINELQSKLQQNKQKMQQLMKMVSEVDRFHQMILPQSHPENSHAAHYSIRNGTGRTIIVNHSAENATYNFVLRNELVPGSKTIFKVKILNLSNQTNLDIGFGNKEILQGSNLYGPNAICYRCDRYIYLLGKPIDTGNTASNENSVYCEVDLFLYVAKWYINGTIINTSMIPVNLQNMTLYLGVGMHYKNNQVEIGLD